MMFRNYATVAWRNLKKTLGYSFIAIGGLAAGLAIVVLIGLWIYDELTYNRSFKNYDRTGQLYHHVTFGQEIMTINDLPAPIGETLKRTYPDFEEVTVTTGPGKHLLAAGDTKFSETGIFVEPAFIDMFSVRMTEGTVGSLNDVHSVFLSQKAATLFGQHVIGKLIRVDNRDEFTIAGIFEDFPSNSQLAGTTVLLPMSCYFTNNGIKKDNWEDYSFQCFVLMKKGASFHAAGNKIKKVLYDHISADGKSMKPAGLVLPMDQWHLHSEFKDGINTGGSIRLVWLIGTIGMFVLILACINFINLATARSEKRSKEIAVRKVIGSARIQLIFQFLTESFLIATISLAAALVIAFCVLPMFNSLAEKTLVIPWLNAEFILTMVGFVVATGLLAGIYPALYLSSLSPANGLKGSGRRDRLGGWPRKAMVIFQFTTSIVLVVETIVVFQQIEHARNRPVGFDRAGIFHLPVRTDGLKAADYNSLRSGLLATNVVENMAISDFPITGAMQGDASLTWEGKDPSQSSLIAMNSCSHDFPKTNGFQFVEGRDFSRDHSTDSSGVIINELAARLISKSSPLGKKIRFGYGKERTVIGVIKDQIRWSPFSKQSAHMYYINYGSSGYLTVRLKTIAGRTDAMQKVASVIKRFDDGAPFEYTFLDDDYSRLFKGEERIGKLASVFAGLAIFISCIGMFGLAGYAAGQRSKEIGIRKVLGASVRSIWQMLTVDFVGLVMMATLVACPAAWFFAGEWLTQYDYRVELSWSIFVATALAAIGITLMTVSYQAIRAALANPVSSIRTE